MKIAAIQILLVASLWLGGCAAPPKSTADSAPAPAKAIGSKADSTPARRTGHVATAISAGLEPAPNAVPSFVPKAEAIHDPEPDAVIKFEPSSAGFSMEMESRLAKIADEARQDERIILRLESHVPDIGSPALNIGIAEKTLQKVKERLQALGVLPRRILLASFGGEHATDRDPRQHWVEIYMLRPAY